MILASTHQRPSVRDSIAAAVLVFMHAGAILVSLAGPVLILVSTFRADDCWSLGAWRHVFGDLGRWLTLLGNTSVVCAVAVGLSCLVGAALALVLFKTDAHLRRPATVLLLFAAALPLYAVNGSVLAIIGVERGLGSPVVVGLIHALAHLPIVTLIIGASLRAVPADLEEVALVEGVGSLRVLVGVTLRSAVGGVAASAILVALWVTTDYSVADILVVRTFAEEVYTQYALRGRPQEPALVSLPQIVLFGGLLWLLRRGFLTGSEAPIPSGSRRTFGAGRWRGPLSVATFLIPLALAIGPLGLLSSRLHGDADITGLATSFAKELGVSLTTAGAAGLLAAVLGVGLAWFMARHRRWRSWLTAYVIIMLAIPAPVLGMGLVQLFNRPGPAGALLDSPAMLVVAYLIRFLPVAVILLMPALRAIPIECELAAQVDGCGRLAIWRRIIMPQSLPHTLVAAFVVMVLAIGELPCSLFVTPPGYVTVGARFFSLIHYGLYANAAMLCLLSVGCVLAPWLGLAVLLRRRWTG